MVVTVAVEAAAAVVRGMGAVAGTLGAGTAGAAGAAGAEAESAEAEATAAVGPTAAWITSGANYGLRQQGRK